MPDTLPWEDRGLGIELEERLAPGMLASPDDYRGHWPASASPVLSPIATLFTADNAFGEGMDVNAGT